MLRFEVFTEDAPRGWLGVLPHPIIAMLSAGNVIWS